MAQFLFRKYCMVWSDPGLVFEKFWFALGIKECILHAQSTFYHYMTNLCNLFTIVSLYESYSLLQALTMLSSVIKEITFFCDFLYDNW